MSSPSQQAQPIFTNHWHQKLEPLLSDSTIFANAQFISMENLL